VSTENILQYNQFVECFLLPIFRAWEASGNTNLLYETASAAKISASRFGTTTMKIRYALESRGEVIREMTGEVNNDAEWDALRKAFWSKISLPWGGSTVSVRLVG
jgi:hypothetical protein